MNATIYLFGEFNCGYTQYPDDYASAIFKKFYADAKSTTQIAIHRDGNLMYYGYIRKLEHEKYIGFCVVLNGLMLNAIERLFLLFENTVSNLVIKGQLIHFNEQGEIVSYVDKLYINNEEINLITETLRARFNQLRNSITPLPTESYGTAKDSVKDFTITNDLEEIIKSSYTNGYTYIYKSKGFNKSHINSYKGVLAKISKENERLKNENTKLQEQFLEVQHQKRQIRKVVLLTLTVIGCVIGLYLLYNNLNNTQYQLSDAKESIKEKDDTIAYKNDKIASLEDTVDSVRYVCRREREERQETEKQLNNIFTPNPFVVTKCEVTSRDFHFDYYAIEQQEITVTLKAISEKSPEVLTSTHNITIHRGNGSVKLEFNYDLDSYYYYVVLMYNNRIMTGRRW